MKSLKLLTATSMLVAALSFPNPAVAQNVAAPDGPRISTCCPPLATYPVTSMFNSVQANIGGPYHLNFTMAAAFDAQMAAYVALLKTLDPSITAMAVVATAYNGGSGASPVIGGGALQLGIPYWIPPPSPSSGVLWPFFTAAANLPVNTWTVVEMNVWVGRRNGQWVRLCEPRRFAFRPQLIGLRSSSGSRSGFIDYNGPAPRARPAPPPPIPQAR
jgi:hypothetical protein